MRIGSRRAEDWRARSRAGIALVVLTAWFGTLLVAAPLSASAATVPPPTIASSPTTPGADPSPMWTFTLPADSSTTTTTTDPVSSDTTTVTIDIAHRAQCAFGRDLVAPAITDVLPECTPPASTPDLWSYAASLGTTAAATGTYHLYVRDAQTTTTTSTPYLGGQPQQPTTTSVTEYSDPPTTSSYAYDRTPPTFDAFTPPTSATGTSPNPTWSYAVSDSGSTTAPVVSCTLTPAGAAQPNPVTCSSTSYTAALTTDGGYDFVVTATDPLGNASSRTSSYTLSSAGQPGLTVSPLTGQSSVRPVWTMTPPTGTTPTGYTATLTPPGATSGTLVSVVFDPSNGTATYSPDLSTAAPGTYRLTVTATVDGRPSAPVFADYLLDNAPPAAPAPVASSTIGRTPPTWTFAMGDASSAACQLLFGSRTATPGTAVDCSTGSYTPSATLMPAEGNYYLLVTLTDAALNSSSGTSAAAYYYDPNPVVLTVTPVNQRVDASGNPTGFDPTPSWSISAPGANTVSCVLTEAGVSTPVDSASCPTAFTSGFSMVDNVRYTLTVTATDLAGNVTVATRTYDFDNVKPVVTVSGPTPASPSNVTTVSWTSSDVETGLSTECSLYRGSVTGTPIDGPVPCARTTSYSLTIAGTYIMVAVDIDAAGNRSVAVPGGDYVLDLTPPTNPTVSGPTGPSSNPKPGWTITGVGDATRITCRVVAVRPAVGPVPPVPPYGACPDPATFALPYDGLWRLDVITYDAAGNPSDTIPSPVYELDASAPAAPQVTGPVGHGTQTSGSYSYAGESGTTPLCQLVRKGDPAPDFSACPSPLQFAYPSDGFYTLNVRLVDAAQNLGAIGSSGEYERDTTAPGISTVSGPVGPSQDRAPAWTFTTETANGVTSLCRLTRGSLEIATSACTSGFTADLTGQADGPYVLTVVSTDLATNATSASSAPYELDTTKPVAPSVIGPAGPSQNRNPVFSWTAELGTSAECSLQEKAGIAGVWSGCAAPYAPSLAGDGSWVLSVRLIDAAKNVSDTGVSGAYVFDTTPPATPVVTPPSSPGRDLAPSWSAVTEEGSKVDCRLTGPGQLGAWAPCTLPTTTPVSGEGTYTFEVRATDAAGNVSPVGSGSYVLDITAPPAPVVTQPTGPGRNRSPQIAFTSEAGTTGSCKLTHGTTVLSDSAACNSPATLDLTGLPDGAYTLSVRAVDAAGNVGPAGTATYVLDTTAPAAPTMTLVAGSPSSDRSPAFAFNTESGTTASCKVTVPGGAVKDLPCTGTVSLDLSNATDGDYVLSIRATDQAGNVGAPATVTYVLDSNAPVAPSVVGPVSPGNNRAPVWKISSASPAECRLSRGTTALKDWAPCGTSYAADLYSQPDGAYLLEARVIGTTAATSSRYRLDTTAPAAATIVGPPSPGTDRKPTWAVSSTDTTATAQCRVTLFGGGLVKDYAPCGVSPAGSLFLLDLTGAGDGTYTLSVRLTDAASNVGPVATSDYVLDTSAPSAVGVVAPASPGSDTTPTWLLTSAGGVKLECRVSTGQKVITDFAPCASTFTADLTGLPDGTYTLTVHALSAAGTPGPETTSGYLLDTTAAGTPGSLTGPSGPSRDRAPRWTFTLPAGTTGLCTVTFQTRVVVEGTCSSPYTLDLSNAADGTYTLTVRALDLAGNLSSPSTAGYVLKTTAPPAPTYTTLPGSPSSTTDPSWGFALPRGTTGQCRLLQGGITIDDWLACQTPVTAHLSGKPDGVYTMQVRAIDLAGNTSGPATGGGDYTFDRTAAPLAQFAQTPATPSNDTSPSWVIAPPAVGTTAALTGTPQTECRLTTAARVVGGWFPCSGTYTAPTSGDGSYLLEVRAYDATGARGPVTSSAYLLDTRPPAAPRFVDPIPPTVGKDVEVAWSWADDGDIVECHVLRNGSPLSGFAACTSPQVFSIGRLGEATYTIEARAVDAAGNLGPVGSASYRYDITPPAAPVFAAGPPSRSTATSVGWSYAVPVDAHAVCVVTRNGTVVSEGACSNAFSLDLRGQQPATWVLSVHFVDSAGNVGRSTSGSYTLTSALAGISRLSSPGGPGNTDNAGGPAPGRPTGPDTTSRPVPGAPALSNGDAPILTGPGADPRPGGTLTHVVPDVIKRSAIDLAHKVLTVPGATTDVPAAIKNVLGGTITKPQLPLALLVIVLLFLLVQNRVDRRDPKLAAAPVSAEPELTFGPILRPAKNLRPGGATA